MTEYETLLLIGLIIGLYISNIATSSVIDGGSIDGAWLGGLMLLAIQAAVGIGVFVILVALNLIFDAI